MNKIQLPKSNFVCRVDVAEIFKHFLTHSKNKTIFTGLGSPNKWNDDARPSTTWTIIKAWPIGYNKCKTFG